jgi:hypothetical protein
VITGEEADVGRSPNWYHFSYTYGELLENPTAAMGGLLEKLTVAVERYHKMLRTCEASTLASEPDSRRLR